MSRLRPPSKTGRMRKNYYAVIRTDMTTGEEVKVCTRLHKEDAEEIEYHLLGIYFRTYHREKLWYNKIPREPIYDYRIEKEVRT